MSPGTAEASSAWWQYLPSFTLWDIYSRDLAFQILVLRIKPINQFSVFFFQKDCICRSLKSCLKLVTPIIGILLNFFMYEFSIYFVERKTVYKCINLMSPNLLLIRSRRGCAQIQWLTRSTGAGNRCSRQLSSCQLPSTCRPPKLAFCLPWQVCSHPGSMKRGRDH